MLNEIGTIIEKKRQPEGRDIKYNNVHHLMWRKIIEVEEKYLQLIGRDNKNQNGLIKDKRRKLLNGLTQRVIDIRQEITNTDSERNEKEITPWPPIYADEVRYAIKNLKIETQQVQMNSQQNSLTDRR